MSIDYFVFISMFPWQKQLRSRQHWTGQHGHQAKTPDTKTIKRALQCVRWQNTLKPIGAVLTNARIISPHWCQRHKPRSDAVEITLKKLAYLASVRLRGVKMEPHRKTMTHLLWRHDHTADAPSSFLATSDFQDGGRLSSVFFFPSMSEFAVGYFALMHT